jgi:archaellum biogenesis protein FlaJ (TadC family)
LYSTFLVNNASSALVWADVFKGKESDESKRKAERLLGVVLPLGTALMFVVMANPRAWVIFAGITQTLTFPLLGYAAIRVFPHKKKGHAFLIFTVVILVIAAVTLLFLI